MDKIDVIKIDLRMYIGINLGERAVQSLDSSSSVTLGTVYRCCGRLGDVVYVSL